MVKKKTTADFIRDEANICKDIAELLKKRGYDAEVTHNIMGENMLNVYLKDEDGEDARMFAIFEQEDMF